MDSYCKKTIRAAYNVPLLAEQRVVRLALRPPAVRVRPADRHAALHARRQPLGTLEAALVAMVAVLLRCELHLQRGAERL